MNLEIIKIIDKYIGIPVCIILIIHNNILKLLGLRKNKISNRKNILMVKFFGFGNLILAMPAIKAIKEKYPDSKITFLTINKNKNLYENFDSIDKVLYFDSGNFRSFFNGIIKLLIHIKKQKYDCILDFEQFARISAIISYLTGIRDRVGFDIKWQFRGPLYPTRIKYSNKQHMVYTFYDVAMAVGCKKTEKLSLLKVPYSSEDEKIVSGILNKNQVKNTDVLVGFHVGSGQNFVLRRWPEEKFAKVGDYLVEKHNAKIIFTGSKSERTLIDNTINNMKEKNKKNIILANDITLKQLALLIEKCSLFICTDTGPLHLASAMKTPSISFYGPNTPYLYGPIGENNTFFYKNLKCSPCLSVYNAKSANCRNPMCLKKVSVEEVINVISKKYSKILKNKKIK